MNWINQFRLRHLERQIAGLHAKYAAVKDLEKLCAKDVPWHLVVLMYELPQQIAQLETLQKQIEQS